MPRATTPEETIEQQRKGLNNTLRLRTTSETREPFLRKILEDGTMQNEYRYVAAEELIKLCGGKILSQEWTGPKLKSTQFMIGGQTFMI